MTEKITKGIIGNMKVKIFIPYLIYLIVMTAIAMLIPLFGHNTQESGIAAGMAGQIIMIPVLIFILHRENRLKTAFSIKGRPFKADILFPALAGLVIGAVTTFGVAEFGLGTEEAFKEAQAVYNHNILLTAVSSVLFAPFMEELLFRELMYRKLESVYGVLAAVIISSVLFALGHASLIQMIYGFLMGILFALNYRERGTVISPMMMHMAANLATIIFWGCFYSV